MSDLSERLRKIALGPAPEDTSVLGDWCHMDVELGMGRTLFQASYPYLRPVGWQSNYFEGLTEDECRMALLFVAEAVEDME